MRVAVTKMHGACNDFVVVDRRTQRLGSLREFARWACDRRAGIGADGLIAIEAASRRGLAMRTVNADGSEAEMCGNGIRCAARWLDEAGEGGRLEFATPAGTVRTEVVSRGPEYVVRVEMGVPRVRPLPGRDGALVDLGNPHVVLFRERADDFDLRAEAERLQRDYPGGANVHVAAAEGGSRLRVRHWERGVGETPACGTGAVACAAAAVAQRGLASPVDVLVPGGRLLVEWDGAGRAVLVGPAVRVFDTEVPADPHAER